MDQPGKADETDGILSGVVKTVKSCLGNFNEDMELDNTIEISDCYKFNHKKRGIAAVVVNIEVNGYKPRKGAEKDEKLLSECFNYLGFDVRVFCNYTSNQLVTAMDKMAKEMTRDPDFDCFIFAMSSHGNKKSTWIDKDTKIEEDVINTTDGYIEIERILEFFKDENCKGLIGKPRLFFLQACRGDFYDKGIDVVDGANDEMVITPVSLPCFKDYLVMYATPPGFVALRRPEKGSWFIIELCRILQKADSHRPNIMKHLRHVSKCVGRKFQHEGCVESPVIYSKLIKDIHFN